MIAGAAEQAVERAARTSYGQLVAFLAGRAHGDVAGTEDALGEAFLAALLQWPAQGVPEKPEAWLIATAKRRLIDAQRRARVRLAAMDELQRGLDAAQAVVEAGDDFPDERLKLLFVCAHPAIDPAARTPLMLQTVLGLDATRIAAAFVTSPAAMQQRLVRVKAKIRAAGIPFAVPPPGERRERLEFVLDAIYAAFTSDWDEASPLDGNAGLASEAIWLARLTLHMLPDEPEAAGLLALLLYCDARRAARRSPAGEYVPITEQDVGRWSAVRIDEAEALLQQAARQRTPGRFQLEAAIQSVHCARARTGETDWATIARLYEGLVLCAPALGARIGRAVALAQAGNPVAGLARLEEIPRAEVREHQTYWRRGRIFARNPTGGRTRAWLTTRPSAWRVTRRRFASWNRAGPCWNPSGSARFSVA